MKINLKNIFKTTPFFFFLLAKISFIILFLVAHARTVANMDASHPWQIGFQDPATPIMEGIIFFNGLLMTFMIFIACLVGWLLYKSLTLFDESVHVNSVGFTHSTLLEVVWTIIPAVILMIISIPSYNLLYAMDEVIDPSLTIKVVGHQWYWSYECSDFEVSPKAQKENLEVLEVVDEVKTTLKHWVDVISDASIEADAGEKQTQITLVKDLLNFVDNNLTNLSEEHSMVLANRLNLINLLIVRNEARKDYHGIIQDLTSGEMAGILSSVKAELEKGSLIPEQQEAVVKILKRFKQYLRITENIEPGVTDKELIKSLESSKNEGSDSGNNSGSDTDSDDDDGSVITDLMDFDKSNPSWEWCELVSAENKYDFDDDNLTKAASDALVSERICNNAAAIPENNNTPFSELMENLKQDKREFKKAIPIADLSEDKLIDTQLIEHQLRLTRPEREGFSSEYAWNSAVVASNFADYEFKDALAELNNAKLHSHWAKIELAAANVNKLTAEYLQADASLGVTDPLLIRSLWINKKGYYSWNDFLRLAIKKLSDAEKLVFLHADEELNGANSLLGKAQRDLTQAERDKSNSIADNAKAEFMAMEKEVIPAVEEFTRGKIILANAKSELKGFQDISDRADVRLNRAQKAFDQAKVTSDRTQARLNAAESVFKSAQAKLTGSDIISEPEFNKNNLDFAQLKFENLKEKFDKAVVDVHSAKSDLLVAQERLKRVKVNFEKTEKVFEDTGLLEKQTPVEGKPTEYYHNFLWEIHKEDLAFVKAQLKTDTAELESAKLSLELAEKRLSEVGGDLLEAELNSNKALIDYLNNNNSDLSLLNKTKKHVSGIELSIAEAIYTKALSNFESEGSNNAKLLLARAAKALSDAKSNATNDYLGSVLDNNFNNIDSEKLISDYAESCLTSAQEELKDAEADYAKATAILGKAENLLENLAKNLSKDYNNPYLDTLKALYNNTLTSLEERINQLNLTKSKSSPLDIKLEPGILQSRSYKEVLLAKAELANIKWLCARVAKTLDIPLSEEVKPFNVQFSHLESKDSSTLVEGSAEGGSDDKKGPKSVAEIKEILSKLEGKEISYSSAGLQKEILQTFSELLKTVDKTEAKNLINILDNALSSMVVEEVEKNQHIKSQIAFIKEELANSEGDDAVDDDEEKQRINFDSYLIADDDLVIPEASGTGKAGTVFRLLEVDNRLFVPTNTHIRMLITSADVLHSWAVPSLGVKVDACPGRLNQVFLFVKREGVFYGQCSELCGVNHGFMPIVVQAVSQDEYLTWVGKRLCS